MLSPINDKARQNVLLVGAVVEKVYLARRSNVLSEPEANPDKRLRCARETFSSTAQTYYLIHYFSRIVSNIQFNIRIHITVILINNSFYKKKSSWSSLICHWA